MLDEHCNVNPCLCPKHCEFYKSLSSENNCILPFRHTSYQDYACAMCIFVASGRNRKKEVGQLRWIHSDRNIPSGPFYVPILFRRITRNTNRYSGTRQCSKMRIYTPPTNLLKANFTTTGRWVFLCPPGEGGLVCLQRLWLVGGRKWSILKTFETTGVLCFQRRSLILRARKPPF